MTKSKCKILLLVVVIISLISTLSFATVEPRTAEEDTNDIAAISTDDENAVQVTSEDETQTTTDEEQDWTNSDLYLAKDKVDVTGVVDGNAFIVGDEVTISGEIGGDVFVCANKLTISGGYIYSSLFAVANEININGIVYDVYAAANSFTLDTDGYVYRDLKVTANTIALNGTVRRDAYLSGANFNFSENSGSIGGNLKYSANSEVVIPEGFVTGETTFDKTNVEEVSVGERVLSYVLNAIATLIYTLVVALLAIWLAPKFVEKASTMTSKKAVTALGVGILSVILITIALVLVLLSTICPQLFIAGLLLFIVICMSGLAFASIYFGSLFAKLVKWDIKNSKVKFVLSTLIAALLLWLVSQIPFIGWFIGLIVGLLGIGTLIFNVIPKKVVVKEEVQTEE